MRVCDYVQEEVLARLRLILARATVEVGVTVVPGIRLQVRKPFFLSASVPVNAQRGVCVWAFVRDFVCVACAIARNCFRMCGCSEMLACRVPSGPQMLVPVLRLCVDANASSRYLQELDGGERSRTESRHTPTFALNRVSQVSFVLVFVFVSIVHAQVYSVVKTHWPSFLRVIW